MCFLTIFQPLVFVSYFLKDFNQFAKSFLITVSYNSYCVQQESEKLQKVKKIFRFSKLNCFHLVKIYDCTKRPRPRTMISFGKLCPKNGSQTLRLQWLNFFLIRIHPSRGHESLVGLPSLRFFEIKTKLQLQGLFKLYF